MHINLNKPLVYVTRDIERALGMEPAGRYFVISNDTPYGREVQKKYPDNVWLIPSEDKEGLPGPIFDTYDLLLVPGVQQFIEEHAADVLVFQNTPRIERFAKEKGWNLLNPSADISRTVEEKISQVAWLGEDAKLLPPHKITTVKEVNFQGKKFVLQFNHSHTGQGTYVIDSKDLLAELAKKFPNRECRVTDFIEGPIFTLNAVVDIETISGSPSYQITGLPPFTDLPFSTIGNDWAFPLQEKFMDMQDDILNIAGDIGSRLHKSGWHGLFGIDVVYDSKEKRTYLLEINARQPASAVFESRLQKQASPKIDSIFEVHVAALRGAPHGQPRGMVHGAQIVKRVTEKRFDVDVAALKSKGLFVMEYKNTDHNKELFRIQTHEGIMEAHEKPNALGKFIASCIR